MGCRVDQLEKLKECCKRTGNKTEKAQKKKGSKRKGDILCCSCDDVKKVIGYVKALQKKKKCKK